MKNTATILLLFLAQMLFGHGQDFDPNALRHWKIQHENKTVDAFFLMSRDGQVYMENTQQQVLHFPLDALSKEDKEFVQLKTALIEHVNKQTALPVAPIAPEKEAPLWLWAFLLAGTLALVAALPVSGRRRWAMSGTLALALLLYSFKTEIAAKILSTDPAFVDAAFQPFKPAVNTFWDDTYFYVESQGIPDHEMMAGIISWQQQVPIPQCYIGSNAWSIPLNPQIASVPVPVNAQHFLRGAVAIAANGVAIFNPHTNTGVDAFLDGQLDNFGGHSGRADDYHYHTAPLHLDAQTPEVLPIAFALDGFAIYGSHEPDGSPMNTLDANHGHFGTDGVYHYHGTPEAPYMIGNMVGVVTEDSTLQIIPQAKAKPVRPSLTPLQGAVITHCEPNTTNNGYILTYTRNGQTYQVDYSWTPNGVYTYKFIAPTGTTTQVYNGFVPCQVPVDVKDLFSLENQVTVSPNPATGSVTLLLNGNISPSDVRNITVYGLNGARVFQSQQFQSRLDLGNLAKGIYIVTIQFEKGSVSKKVNIL